MKKWSAFLLVCVLLCMCGCNSKTKQKDAPKEEQMIYPSIDEVNASSFYDSLSEEDKDIYRRICGAIEQHNTEDVLLAKLDSKEACMQMAEKVATMYTYLVYEQPQYFWVNASEHESVIWNQGDDYQVRIRLSYLMDQDEAADKKIAFDARVNEIVQEAEKQSDTFEQVLYIYETIVKGTEYDKDLAESDVSADLGRSAYGCLVDGKTVCSGYALAFNMVMKELGYECGVEFDKLGMTSLSDGHVWNYAKLDGEYYYFDLTWDDTAFDGAEYNDYIDCSHMYFAITEQELKASHTISEQSVAPSCTGETYNYFRYRNLNMEQYDFESAKEKILSQENEHYIELRFETEGELLKAEKDLLKDGKIYDILPDLKSAMYAMSDAKQHLYLFFE